MADASVQVVGASQFSVIGTDDAAGVIIRDNSSIAVNILISLAIMSFLLWLFRHQVQPITFKRHGDDVRIIFKAISQVSLKIYALVTHGIIAA